jgi:hypothetical protein
MKNPVMIFFVEIYLTECKNNTLVNKKKITGRTLHRGLPVFGKSKKSYKK